MKRIVSLFALFVGVLMFAQAQTAQSVLDKCAKKISAKSGVTADFVMESTQYGNSSGTISVKGQKFMATTAAATMWFDGKTLWTYMSKNNEVNVTTPTEAQLQALNPYNFINMYKKGFSYTMTKSATSFVVHLTATDAKRKVQEMFITVENKGYTPTVVKMRQGQKWTTFTVKNLKTSKLDDAVFRFNSKEFPSAEVIDLR